MKDYAIETFDLTKRFGIKPLEEWKGWADQLTHLVKGKLQKKGEDGKKKTPIGMKSIADIELMIVINS